MFEALIGSADDLDFVSEDFDALTVAEETISLAGAEVKLARNTRLLKGHQEQREQSKRHSQKQADRFRKSPEHPPPFRAETSTPGGAA